MSTKGACATPMAGLRGSSLQRSARLLGPSPAVRIIAHLRRFGLDRALTDGVDPAVSPLLAARAAQLSRASTRARIADGLERLSASAELPRSRVRIRPARTAVRANRSALLELAGMLRDEGPLYARGVAMLEAILVDGASPAYTDRHGEALARRLEAARAGLLS